MKLDDYQYGYDKMTRKRMLEKMRQGWKSNETPCGRGSELGMTGAIRGWLPNVVHDYECNLVADVGAGDLNWIQHILWKDPAPHVDHYDLVPRHPDVEQFDATSQVLSVEYDLIICRHVLNHLSCHLALEAVYNFVESGSRYLLMTNCENQIEYWGTCGFYLRQPINRWNDATKWWCELHDLRRPEGLWLTS